jgi:hypothetical protein
LIENLYNFFSKTEEKENKNALPPYIFLLTEYLNYFVPHKSTKEVKENKKTMERKKLGLLMLDIFSDFWLRQSNEVNSTIQVCNKSLIKVQSKLHLLIRSNIKKLDTRHQIFIFESRVKRQHETTQRKEH